MRFTQEIRNVTSRLNRLTKIMNKYPRDSRIFMNAEDLYTSKVFGIMTPQDYGLIADYLSRKLTNRDFARIIVAYKHNESLTDALRFPASIVNQIRKIHN